MNMLSVVCDRIVELNEQVDDLKNVLEMKTIEYDELLTNYRKLNQQFIDTSELKSHLQYDYLNLESANQSLRCTVKEMFDDLYKISLYRRFVVLFTGRLR